MRAVAFPLLCAALVFTASPSRGEDKTKDAPAETTEYYPLKAGTTWSYKADGKTTYTVTVAGFEKVGEEQCARLEMKREGAVSATEDVTVKKDGVYRCAFAGSKVTPPVCFLKLPVKKGERWTYESKLAGTDLKGGFTLGEEKGVKVPAGTYDTLTVTSTNDTTKIDGQTPAVTYYFAKKVGLVKSVVEIGGVKVVSELEKFEEPKK